MVDKFGRTGTQNRRAREPNLKWALLLRFEHPEEHVGFCGIYRQGDIGGGYGTIRWIIEPRAGARQAHAVGLQDPAFVSRPGQA